MRSSSACFFDLYGTLVDIHTDESKPGFWKRIAAYYTDRGAAWTWQTLRREYRRPQGPP